MIFFPRYVIPGLVVSRYGFVPTPILNKARRGSQQVEGWFETVNRFRYSKRDSRRPRMQNVVKHPIVGPAAHSWERGEVRFEETRQFVYKILSNVKRCFEDGLDHTTAHLGENTRCAKSSDDNNAIVACK